MHIGLNRVDPARYDGWDGALNACEFDAKDMKAIAESRGFEARTLMTAEATSDAVLTAISEARTSVVPEIQYQVIEPRAVQSKSFSRGTGMPSGPPVKRASLLKTMAMSRPMPSVATAR